MVKAVVPVVLNEVYTDSIVEEVPKRDTETPGLQQAPSVAEV